MLLYWAATGPGRWAGKTRSRSEHGRSEAVTLAREVVQVTAVRPASCGEGNGRATARPTKAPSLRPF
jgi:hypothetical protein